MSQRLVPWPRAAAAVLAGCALVVAAMSIAYHRERTGTAFDDVVDRFIRKGSPRLMNDIVHVADPEFVALLFLVLIAVALVRRRPDIALLALLTPIGSVLLVEHVLKPLVHRTQSDPYVVHAFGYEPLAFPSGHESGIGSFIAVCGLLVLGSGWRLRTRVGVLVAMALAGLVAAIGLVGRYYHYATDTIGAMLVCTAVTLTVGFAVDAIFLRIRPHDRATAGRSPAVS
ncbi:hypothetical protein [Jatrophihabitans sp.]|uniref:hypothetical protein n=1 Tax=Jatrophihabitans sp. TaxID=1932789 RepID=UPI0030C72503|nr:putative rane protein [Jatrophihabitans sp.]